MKKFVCTDVLVMLVLACSLTACCMRRAPLPAPSLPAGALVLRSDVKPPLTLTAEPAGAAALRLRITAKRTVVAPPAVEISVAGKRGTSVLATTSDAARSTYVVTVPVSVGDQLMVAMRARARDGRELLATARVSTILLEPAQTGIAYSANGQVSLMVPPGALPPDRWLVFGPADAPAPAGRMFISEPQLIAAGTAGERLTHPGALRFILMQSAALAPFDPATARIERFDPRRRRWVPQPSRREPLPLTGGLVLQTDRLGIYAVTARRR